MARPTIWVCFACGKRSHDQLGADKIDQGWDESCMLNSAECFTDMVIIRDGRVVEVAEGGVLPGINSTASEAVSDA